MKSKTSESTVCQKERVAYIMIVYGGVERFFSSSDYATYNYDSTILFITHSPFLLPIFLYRTGVYLSRMAKYPSGYFNDQVTSFIERH